MRRSRPHALTCSLGARRARRRHCAQAVTPPPQPATPAEAGRSRAAAGRTAAPAAAPADTEAGPQPVRADRPGALHRRARDQRRRRPGALSALPGQSATGCSSPASAIRSRSRTAPTTFHARADNVGWRDQEYFGDYDRVGKLSLTGSWQQIPQFYSVDTMTPYTGTGGTLVLDDATQRADPERQPGSTPTLPIAPQFELRERRDIGRVDVVATPTPKLDVTASFTTQKHGGELPWGASFGFSNDVEVALPYDSRANDFTLGTEWTNAKNMLRVAYTGSWFDNLAATLIWDSPLRIDDAADAPARGRMSLWPSNSAQTISFGGYTKLARRTQVTGFFSFGLWSNDEPLQPFTINSALPQIRAAARHDGGGSARLLDEPEPDLAPHDRLAVRRALPQLRLLQPDAGDEHHAVQSTTTRAWRRRRPAVRISTPTIGPPSTPTRPGAG